MEAPCMSTLPASAAPTAAPPADEQPALNFQRPAGISRQRATEFVIENLLRLAGFGSILITVGIVFVLLYETIPFFAWQHHTPHLAEAVAGRTTVTRLLVSPGDTVEQGAPMVEAAVVEDGVSKPTRLTATMFTRIDAIKVKPGDAITRDTELLAVSQRVRFSDFFGDKLWAPVFDVPRFGIWSLIVATLVTTAVALLIAIPAGTVSAIWLSEYCKPQIREWIKPALELLAAVPTVVYGYFALLIVTPILQRIAPFVILPLVNAVKWCFNVVISLWNGNLIVYTTDLPGFNMLSAGLVMGIMIIPYVASLSEDAMRSVPMQLREGAYATGATRFQTATRVLFPAALSGITAAYILAISRAVGETMIVAIAAGLQSRFTFDPTESAASISAAIVQAVMGDLPHDSVAYRAVFAAGLVLLMITLFFNIAGYMLRKRYREAY
jgi:phosphate transport system permease protein